MQLAQLESFPPQLEEGRRELVANKSLHLDKRVYLWVYQVSVPHGQSYQRAVPDFASTIPATWH